MAFHIDAPVEKREKQFMVRQGNRTLEVIHQNGTDSIRYSDNDDLMLKKQEHNYNLQVRQSKKPIFVVTERFITTGRKTSWHSAL